MTDGYWQSQRYEDAYFDLHGHMSWEVCDCTKMCIHCGAPIQQADSGEWMSTRTGTDTLAGFCPGGLNGHLP